jgi:hypothetical protein
MLSVSSLWSAGIWFENASRLKLLLCGRFNKNGDLCFVYEGQFFSIKISAIKLFSFSLLLECTNRGLGLPNLDRVLFYFKRTSEAHPFEQE